MSETSGRPTILDSLHLDEFAVRQRFKRHLNGTNLALASLYASVLLVRHRLPLPRWAKCLLILPVAVPLAIILRIHSWSLRLTFLQLDMAYRILTVWARFVESCDEAVWGEVRS